jgi:hypothetical protein
MELNVKNRRSLVMRWANMLDRCDNPRSPSYKRYGAIGIDVCDRWKNFHDFVKDLPDGYFIGAELDRIDNLRGYSPENVRWVSKKENSRNRRSNRWIEFNGVKKCLKDWAEILGINSSSLDERIKKWGLEKALTTSKGCRLRSRWDGHKRKDMPVQKARKLYRYNGSDLTMRELVKVSSVGRRVLRKRIEERGWSVEQAVELPKLDYGNSRKRILVSEVML